MPDGGTVSVEEFIAAHDHPHDASQALDRTDEPGIEFIA